MTIHLRDATRDDLPAIARIAADAFHPLKDPLTGKLFPPHLNPPNTVYGEAAHSWRAARKSSNMESDRTVFILAIDDSANGQIVGFALWESPAKGEESEEAKSAPTYVEGLDSEAYHQVRAALADEVKQTYGERGTRDVWYLDYLAVDPAHQRRGIGKRLLDWGINEAAKDGRDCYLVATATGQPLYLKAGFEEVRIVSLLGVPQTSMILRNRQ